MATVVTIGAGRLGLRSPVITAPVLAHLSGAFAVGLLDGPVPWAIGCALCATLSVIVAVTAGEPSSAATFAPLTAAIGGNAVVGAVLFGLAASVATVVSAISLLLPLNWLGQLWELDADDEAAPNLLAGEVGSVEDDLCRVSTEAATLHRVTGDASLTRLEDASLTRVEFDPWTGGSSISSPAKIDGRCSPR